MAEKCTHDNCTCTVSQPGAYCSDRCREHDERSEDRCTCGHSECEVTELAV